VGHCFGALAERVELCAGLDERAVEHALQRANFADLTDLPPARPTHFADHRVTRHTAVHDPAQEQLGAHRTNDDISVRD